MTPTIDEFQRARAQYPMPFTRIELAVFAVKDGKLQVLLGQRSEPPHAGKWALPGGVVRIDLDTNLDAACQRVARERLGVALTEAQQVIAVGARRRDPRAPWALSVVYRAMVRPHRLHAVAGKRLVELQWFTTEEATTSALAFDHAMLIARAVTQLRDQVSVLHFPPGLMDQTFTLGELQSASEAVLGHALDKSSFRRRLDAAQTVEPIAGEVRSGPFRPAQVYRLPG
ncbi:MAG: NUDIX domain-containing protein [Zoogloea sp.]|nr:NUDIX domain-containing protein [Zoogloea sp.]